MLHGNAVLLLFINIQVAENYKNEQFQYADVDFLCNPNQPSAIILFGLQCLDHYLKYCRVAYIQVLEIIGVRWGFMRNPA